MIDKLVRWRNNLASLVRLARFTVNSPHAIPQFQQLLQKTDHIQQVLEQTGRNVAAIALALAKCEIKLAGAPQENALNSRASANKTETSSEDAAVHAVQINAGTPGPSDPPDSKPLTSCLCTMDQYLTPAYGYWCRKISEDFLWNRKQWEFVFIAQALWERGFLKPGKLGIGFGVGKEPLSALFASFGCRIIATDAPEDTAYVPAWKDTDQYAASLEDLNEKGVCAPEDFRRLVTFRFVDMNVLPEDLPAADFIWSYCSAEHIGSMDKTKDFLVKSMKCLKPGGLAVHTTEFNVSSDEETLDIPTLALLRKKDIIEIERRLSYGGHRVAPIDFDPGQGILDQIVDCLPFSPDAQPHLKLFLSGFVATSIGLIVEKGRTDD